MVRGGRIPSPLESPAYGGMSSYDLNNWANHPEDFMQNGFTSIVAGFAVALTCLATTAAQTAAQDRIVVDSPTYAFIPMEIDKDL